MSFSTSGVVHLAGTPTLTLERLTQHIRPPTGLLPSLKKNAARKNNWYWTYGGPSLIAAMRQRLR